MTARVRIGNRHPGGLWWRIPVVLTIWAILIAPFIAGAIVAITLRRWAADLPEVPDLEAWRASAPRTGRIVAADGSVLAELPFRDGPSVGHRRMIRYGELPRILVEALLAAEDIRFFAHDGVDMHAVVRAAWANYQAGRVVEGASTITQQVARNLLPEEIGRERNLRRKVREALLARRLERRWSKPEILEAYANFAFLGAGAYGVAAAARAYFDVDVAALAAQAAMIAGLAQAPGRADPYKDPAAARARRDEVLERMHRAGFLDDDQARRAIAAPLGLRRPGLAYGSLAPWYTEHVRRLIEEAMPGDYDRGGLEIETAALPALEVATRAAVVARGDQLRRGDGPPPQGAVLVWDHGSGYVEAMVGGRSWRAGDGPGADQFNRVIQACRQPGSAWKPILYAAALEADAITPGTPLRDVPIARYDEVNDVHWKPRSGGRFRGVALAQDALAASLNAPAIDVLDRVGGERVIGLARRLGISTELVDVEPLALGASCVRPFELARAYVVLARRGWAVAPRFVVRVRRGDEALLDASVPEDPTLDPARRLDRLAALAGRDPDERVGAPAHREPLLDPRTAFLIDDMMAAVVARGTATGARRIGRPAAGKTGTTNDNTDAWFVGFDARVLTAVWVGHDQPTTTMGPHDDGAHAALPLWDRVMDLVEGDRPARPVPGPPPPGVERVRVDCETGLLAAPHAGGALDLWFKAGTAPTEVAGRPDGIPTDLGRASSEF